MGGRRQPAPETEEQRTAKQVKKDQKLAIKTAENSSGGGKKVGAVGAQEFDSQARNRRLSIGGGSGYSGGGGSSMSGAQGGRIGANIP